MVESKEPSIRYIAFAGSKRIASGDLRKVAQKAKAVWDREKWASVLIFDDVTSEVIDVDYSGTPDEVMGRLGERGASSESSTEPIGTEGDALRPGRPKLGVVAREVTLLPRHWDWLAGQPGGASVALRKLVEQARLANQGPDQRRRAQEAAYRFLSAMAGNETGYEEALRALFAGDKQRFDQFIEAWPADVRDHARKLAAAALTGIRTVPSAE